MIVRKMVLADVQQVYNLSKACFTEAWSKASIEQEVMNPVASYFVAEQEQEIIGYAGLWHVLDEGEVINIAVHHTKRGKGIGRLLLEKLLSEAQIKGLQVIHLEVRTSNRIAQSLYESYGFKPIAVRKGYYRKPLEDAMIMEWHLEK